MLSCFCKPYLQIPVVEHGVILTHKHITQDPASVNEFNSINYLLGARGINLGHDPCMGRV